MPSPQPFRISRTAKLTLATATTLLLAVVALFLLAAPPRPAEALIPGGAPQSLAPTVSVSNSSVWEYEGGTVTNTGGFNDLGDMDADTVRVSASVGTLTQGGTMTGTWNWSYKTPSVPADETKTVTITARDSTGRYSTKSFSLWVRNLPPPENDMFSGALDLAKVGSLTTNGYTTPATNDYTTPATMEVGEPRPYSPTKDCGIYGVSNSVWFKFTYGGQGGLPPTSSPVASYNFHTKGTNFDTVLALYEGSSVDTLKQIECSNDNSLPNWNDNLSIPQTKLVVGKTYYVQLTGTGGARSGKYQLRYEPRGVSQPKVMAYNILEGNARGGLGAVRDTIKALRPDIVLLNEVRTYSEIAISPNSIPPDGIADQTEWLANQAGYAYYKYHPTTLLGINGTKGVAILSRYPLLRTEYIPVMYQGGPVSSGTLRATIEIEGLTHDVLSTRFPPAQRQPGDDGYDPRDRPINEAGHKQAIDIVRSIPSDHAVIFGGDLNASWSGSPWATEFRNNSGLTDALEERPDPDMGEALGNRADYIYYRGPYSVFQTQHRPSQSLGLPPASDHPYVFAHFLRDY